MSGSKKQYFFLPRYFNKWFLVRITMGFKHKVVKGVMKIVPFKNTLRKAVFNQIYKRNFWDGDESISGKGSSMDETAKIRSSLKSIVSTYKIKSIADAPCGDFYWMRHVDLTGIRYVGYDIVKEIVEKDIETYGSKTVRFEMLDIVTTPVAKSDLIICRDGLVHLSNDHVLAALRNFKKSGSKYLLTTTFPNVKTNEDIPDGMWRRIDLSKPPFNLGKPLLLLNEGSKEDKTKSIGLWKLSDVKL